MPRGTQEPAKIETKLYGGINTALQFSQVPKEQSPSMKNAWQTKLRAIGKRPGSAPITSSALGAALEHLTLYKSSPDSSDPTILATSGTTLYAYAANALTAQTMTDVLESADIYDVDFTDADNNSRKIITDGGNLKEYNGTVVVDVTPAANDADPNPPNDLTNINTFNPIYSWVYSGHVFISAGKDIVWYSKRFYYDYFPNVQFERWVKENDFITGPGMAFDDVCLIPMRRHWGILTGSTVDDFSGNQFLNTVNGNIAPRSPARIIYPDGVQTIAYLSDDGVYEVYDTGFQDTGARRYSTRSLMKNKVDFDALNLTEAQKSAAVGVFVSKYSLYLLGFTDGTTNFIYVYDTRNGEWYPWTGVQLNSMVESEGILYFSGDDGNLHYFDPDLYTDWTDYAQTTGDAVYFQRYSPLLSFEFSGFESYWDSYLVEARQFLVPSTLDVSVIFTNTEATESVVAAWKNAVFVWDVSAWDEAQWANLLYTDIVNAPNPIYFHNKAKYVQVLWSNDRDEPVEIYKDSFMGRVSGR